MKSFLKFAAFWLLTVSSAYAQCTPGVGWPFACVIGPTPQPGDVLLGGSQSQLQLGGGKGTVSWTIQQLLGTPIPIGNISPNTGAFTNLTASGTLNGTGFTGWAASPPPFGATTPNSGAFTTLSASGMLSGSGFTNWAASPPPLGATIPNTGAFTTLTASGTLAGTGFTNWAASPPPIGSVIPNTGAFTTLAASGIAITGGTIAGATVTANSITNSVNTWASYQSGTVNPNPVSFASGATFNPNASNVLLGGSTNVFEPIMTSPAHTAGVFSIPVINSLNDTSFYPSAFQMKWYAPDQTSPVPAGTKGQLSGFECTIDSAQTTSDQSGDSGHCFGGTIYVRGGARFDGIDINPQILTTAATVVGVHVGMDIGVSGGSQFGFQATSIGSFVGSAAFYADPGGGGGWAEDFLGGQTASALSGERSTFRGFSGFGDSSQVNPYVIIGNAGGSGVVGTSNAFSWGLLYNNTRVAIIGPDLVFNSGAPLPSLGVTSGFVHIPYTTSVSGSGGIPTGVPTNGSTGPACEINDVTHVLNCFSPTAGGWYHIAFSAGAG